MNQLTIFSEFATRGTVTTAVCNLHASGGDDEKQNKKIQLHKFIEMKIAFDAKATFLNPKIYGESMEQ